VNAESCDEAAIVVQIVEPTWAVCPTVKVIIDGQNVGVLRNRRARSLPVNTGVHRVSARVGWLRSRTLDLTLASGDRISLECGFRRWQVVPYIACVAVNGIGLMMSSFGLYLYAMVIQGLAGCVMIAVSLMPLAVPGSQFYLRRNGAAADAGALPERMDVESPSGRIEPGRRRFQYGLRGLLILVACCAPLFWIGREMWDRRPGNEVARAFRMFHSRWPSERLSGASDLWSLLYHNSLTPEQVDAVIPSLVTALRDPNPALRKEAAASLLVIAIQATKSSAVVPRAQAVATGLAEGLRDASPDVRHNAAAALLNIYLGTSVSGGPISPLPVDIDRFVDSLDRAIDDPDLMVRMWIFGVLRSVAPRVERAAPARLLKALEASDAATRREAVEIVVKFPVGIESALPALLRILESDPEPWLRSLCSVYLSEVRPSPASIPLLMDALRSPERPVRFKAAALLSRIGPQASEAVPAILPLLKETFEPMTTSEREHPDGADPAVAAAWALRLIAPRTGMADTARTSLMELKRQPGHPWRLPYAESALGLLSSEAAQDSGDDLPDDVFEPVP
jgi:HEAT repeat protein